MLENFRISDRRRIVLRVPNENKAFIHQILTRRLIQIIMGIGIGMIGKGLGSFFKGITGDLLNRTALHPKEPQPLVSKSLPVRSLSSNWGLDTGTALATAARRVTQI